MSTHHVIIGAGPAATNAIETIRQLDGGQSPITLISDEPAHSRMALPYWLADEIPREQTYTGDDQYFDKLNVTARIGVRVERVDPQTRSVTLSDRTAVPFDNLLLATGSSPLRPPIPGADLPGVQPLWSLGQTARALDAAHGRAQPRVVLVGAGFIGLIVLNAMFRRRWKLSVVEKEEQVLPRMLDGDAGRFVRRWLTSREVEIHTGTTVTEIIGRSGGEKLVRLATGNEIPADLVILATGVRANLHLVRGSGIETDEGILVNDRMQTSVANIYAAGDVAQGPALLSDQREIHAIQPTAVDHGRVAGANMAGREVHYGGSLRMNIVDVCGLQTASFGAWDAPDAQATTISNAGSWIYRKLLWRGDQLVGAIFVGRANDAGMLTDLGMVKGILQTQTPLGRWKDFLCQNPFDIRRAYVATGVAARLVKTTLLGQPARGRSFRFGGAAASVAANPAHEVFVGTKAE